MTGIAKYSPAKVAEMERRIIAALEKRGQALSHDLAVKLGLPVQTVAFFIKSLVKNGIIRSIAKVKRESSHGLCNVWAVVPERERPIPAAKKPVASQSPPKVSITEEDLEWQRWYQIPRIERLRRRLAASNGIATDRPDFVARWLDAAHT